MMLSLTTFPETPLRLNDETDEGSERDFPVNLSTMSLMETSLVVLLLIENSLFKASYEMLVMTEYSEMCHVPSISIEVVLMTEPNLPSYLILTPESDRNSLTNTNLFISIPMMNSLVVELKENVFTLALITLDISEGSSSIAFLKPGISLARCLTVKLADFREVHFTIPLLNVQSVPMVPDTLILKWETTPTGNISPSVGKTLLISLGSMLISLLFSMGADAIDTAMEIFRSPKYGVALISTPFAEWTKSDSLVPLTLATRLSFVPVLSLRKTRQTFPSVRLPLNIMM